MLAKNWWLCTVLAASACKMNKIDGNLHATGGHVGTICMRLAATQVQFACNWRATRLQDRSQADKYCVKGRLDIIIIFFSICKSTSSAHASDYSADSP